MTAAERMKALEAARLLDNDVLQAAFAALDEKCVCGWRNSSSEKQRNEYWLKQKIIFEVKRELFLLIQDAAVKERGKDKELNVALERTKGKV